MQKMRIIPPKRLAMDGLCIALFFVLSLFSVEIGGVKLTFDALAVVIAAALFGPADAFLVGLLGAMLEQLVSYGLTVTTVLWILPPACRGLVIGLGLKKLPNARKHWRYLCLCIFAALVTSTLNTLVYYVDAKLMGYYHYALIFGAFFVRLATGVATGVITAEVALPILAALRKSGGKAQ